MAVFITSSINLHTQDHDVDSLALTYIGTPGNVATKAAGNLPITNVAAQYRANNTSPATAYEGLAWNTPNNVDVSENTKILVWAWQFNAPNRIQTRNLANDALIVRMYSGGTSTNYTQFTIGGNDTPAASSQAGPVVFVVDPAASDYDTSAGTYDSSSWSGYGFAHLRENLSGTSDSWVYFTRAFMFGTAQDSNDIPRFYGTSSYDDIITEILGSSYTTKIHVFVNRLGSTYSMLCPFAIGDASRNGFSTNFNDSGSTVISPPNNDSADPRFRLTDQAMRVHLDLISDDIVDISGAYLWGTPAPFNFNSSVGAQVTINNAVFENMGNFTVNSDVTGSATFRLDNNASVIVSGSANLDGSTIEADCIYQNIQNINSITVTGTLTLSTAGTYTFTDCNISDVENVSGGNITIISVGSTITTNSGPNITILETATVTLSGLQSGSEVRIYSGSYGEQNPTEIAGIESSGTSFAFTQSVAGENGFIVVHSLGYEYQAFGLTFPSSSQTIPISQRLDRNYENL